MNENKITRMAREAGFEEGWVEVCNVQEELTNLYNLGRAHEREACAKVCESKLPFQEDYDFQKAAGNTARACAAAIRARGQA